MNADPKRKTHKGDYDRAKEARRHQEEALDDALKNTFPASDPVSIEHRPRPPPTTTDKGLTEAFRSQRSEQLQQEECKCPERSQTSWSAYSNASNRLSTELARSAHARTGSAIPLRSWAPRSCSSNKLPISFRVLSALIVVAERTGGSSHQRK